MPRAFVVLVMRKWRRRGIAVLLFLLSQVSEILAAVQFVIAWHVYRKVL